MNYFKGIWNAGRFIQRGGGLKAVGKLAKASPKYLALYRALLTDPRVPKTAKTALLAATGFVISPLNLPNFIPLIGMLDDVAILTIANGYFMKQIPADVLAQHRAAVGLTPDMP